MKAKLNVSNGFRDSKTSSNFFLSCNLIDGAVDVGEKIYFNEHEIGKIIEVEKNTVNARCDYILRITLSDSLKFDIHDLYGQEVSTN